MYYRTIGNNLETKNTLNTDGILILVYSSIIYHIYI